VIHQSGQDSVREFQDVAKSHLTDSISDEMCGLRMFWDVERSDVRSEEAVQAGPIFCCTMLVRQGHRDNSVAVLSRFDGSGILI
jgi:hypothetical protein